MLAPGLQHQPPVCWSGAAEYSRAGVCSRVVSEKSTPRLSAAAYAGTFVHEGKLGHPPTATIVILTSVCRCGRRATQLPNQRLC